jgi:ABC-2 type transport system ATP-binding protein
MARKRIINSILLWKNDQSTILLSDHFVNEISSVLDEVVIVKDQTVLAKQGADDIRAKGQSIEQYYESFYQEGEDE